MSRRLVTVPIISLFCFAIFAPALQAQIKLTQSQTVEVVSLEDSRCINFNEDVVDITLKSIRLEKDVGFFREDKEAGLVVQMGMFRQSEIDTYVEHPVSQIIDLSGAEEGFIYLGGNDHLLANRFRLNIEEKPITKSKISFVFNKTRGGGAGVKIARAVFSTISNSPIPANPYTSAAKRIGQTVDAVIQSFELDDEKVQPIASGAAVISYSSSDEECDRMGQARDGVWLFIFSSQNHEEKGIENGFITPDRSGEYCFKVDNVWSIQPRISEKTSDPNCSKDYSEMQKLNNPFVSFFVRAIRAREIASVTAAHSFLSSVKSIQDAAVMHAETDEKVKSLLATSQLGTEEVVTEAGGQPEQTEHAMFEKLPVPPSAYLKFFDGLMAAQDTDESVAGYAGVFSAEVERLIAMCEDLNAPPEQCLSPHGNISFEGMVAEN